MDILDLLPDAVPLHLDCLHLSRAVLSLGLTTTAPAAVCPCCGVPSQRVHSRYTRCLADLPCGGVAVQLTLRARKFFCDNARCDRAIFTEPLPGLAARYARHTLRWHEALQLIGFALGGEAGARLAQELRMTTSPDTLLRLIRRWGAVAEATPHVLGVDDWAKRRGHTYGTVLVDLERRKLIDLLPDRTADTLAQWLRQHPGVHIISRDRGGSYAEGARLGAPDAIQVADRWHLLKNLGDALERFLLGQSKLLRGVAESLAPPPAAPTTVPTPEKSAAAPGQVPNPQVPNPQVPNPQVPNPQVPNPQVPNPQVPNPQVPNPGPPLSREQQLSAARRERRLARYQKVLELWQQQHCRRAIAHQLGMDVRTVRRYLQSESFPEIAAHGAHHSAITPYKPYLHRRWEEGEHRPAVLWQELQARGYNGCSQSVQRAIAPWRTPAECLARRGWRRTALPQGQRKLPSARQIIGTLLGWVQKPDEAVATFVDRLLEASPPVRVLQALGQEFYRLVKERDEPRFDAWVQAVQERGANELKQFVHSLLQDEAAVRQGLCLTWSNGQTEGQVNKVKTLKRQMYGRANFDLLRQRLLRTA